MVQGQWPGSASNSEDNERVGQRREDKNNKNNWNEIPDDVRNVKSINGFNFKDAHDK